MRLVFFLGCALGLAGCASASSARHETVSGAPTATAEREVVTVAEALFSAMLARDTAAIRDLFEPGTQIVALRIGGTSPAAPQRRSVHDFVQSIARSQEPLLERMWNPRVEVDGDLAAIWAPYDFRVGERFSHCGHDAFHLVRQGGRWRIVALTYTVQTTGCASGRS